MSDPRFSIIVPIYNIEKYLDQCIQSIREQSYKNIEIVLVNDGSTDGSLEICRRSAEEDSRIKLINKKNGGLVSARKTGLMEAEGEYISFVDGDDTVNQRMYEAVAGVIENSYPDIVAEGFCFSYSDGRRAEYHERIETGLYDKRKLRKEVYPFMMCSARSLQRGIAPAVWAKIFRKEILDKVLPLVDDGIRDGEDAAITYPALLMADTVFFASEVADYQYRVLDDSMSHAYDVNWYVSASKYCSYMQERVGSCGDKEVTDALRFEQFHMFYRYIYKEMEACKKNNESIADKFNFLQEETIVGGTLQYVNSLEIPVPIWDKIMIYAIKHRKYGIVNMIYNLFRATKR